MKSNNEIIPAAAKLAICVFEELLLILMPVSKIVASSIALQFYDTCLFPIAVNTVRKFSQHCR